MSFPQEGPRVTPESPFPEIYREPPTPHMDRESPGASKDQSPPPHKTPPPNHTPHPPPPPSRFFIPLRFSSNLLSLSGGRRPTLPPLILKPRSHRLFGKLLWVILVPPARPHVRYAHPPDSRGRPSTLPIGLLLVNVSHDRPPSFFLSGFSCFFFFFFFFQIGSPDLDPAFVLSHYEL